MGTNCIHGIKIVDSEAPSLPGIIATLNIEDQELRSILLNYGTTKPLVKYCGSIFSEDKLHYNRPKIYNDSSTCFTFGSELIFESFGKQSVQRSDSIIQNHIADIFILVTVKDKVWKIYPCDNHSL
jgi:hypothetical protein